PGDAGAGLSCFASSLLRSLDPYGFQFPFGQRHSALSALAARRFSPVIPYCHIPFFRKFIRQKTPTVPLRSRAARGIHKSRAAARLNFYKASPFRLSLHGSVRQGE